MMEVAASFDHLVGTERSMEFRFASPTGRLFRMVEWFLQLSRKALTITTTMELVPARRWASWVMNYSASIPSIGHTRWRE
jgi:hypothetical protein